MRMLGLGISCRDASRALSRMQDGSVPMPLYLRVRLHLLLCDACKRFFAQVRFLHAAMSRYRQ